MIALLTLLAASSAAVDCKALDDRANREGAIIAGSQAIYEVTGKGRLQFYSAPDARCAMPGAFVIPKDELIAYVEYGDYTSVMFWNSKLETEAEGWVRSSRLQFTGYGISPPQDSDDEHSVSTRFGVVSWRSGGGDPDHATLSVDGKKLRSFRSEEVRLETFEAGSGPEYVLAEFWNPGLNCHYSFAVVELREGQAPRASDEFGECTVLDDATAEKGGVRVDVTQVVSRKAMSFRYSDGKIREP